jgi:hypothetical protein
MLTFLKDLFRPVERPATPQFDPSADGWRRSDLPEAGTRPVRFRVAVPTIPKTAPPRAELTGREFTER